MSDLKIMPVEQCGAVGKCMSSPSSYESAVTSSYSYTKPTMKRIAAVALERLAAARAKDVATHEANLPALEHNKSLVERITKFMTDLGIPSSYSERDTKSRARFPKSIRHDAGYLGDIRRNIKTSDSFEHATQTYERLKNDYDAYSAAAEGEAERIAAAAKQVEAKRKAERRENLELAAIILRYELNLDADWHEVLEALRKRNQRIDLAVAMQQTRNDWNEGFYRVRVALDRFHIETEEDKEIANDVVSCFNTEGDCDGRVFRDTRWSYGALFASVDDQQLAADVGTALSHIRD
jgi:hypothetical protein